MSDPVSNFDEAFRALASHVSQRLPNDPDRAMQVAEDRAEASFDTAEGDLEALAHAMGMHRITIETDVAAIWSETLAWIEISIAFVHFVVTELPRPKRSQADYHPTDVAFAELANRAVAIGHEVVILIRAGFPDGAHARWRHLYESAVISRVLAIGNRGTAARYRNHAYVRLEHHFREFPPSSDTERDFATEVHRAVRRFERRYGKQFLGRDYGWAAEITKRKLNEPHPTLKHLEQLADLGHLRELYQQSHRNVHADPVGARQRRDENGRLHAGPTLVDPRDIAKATIDCLLTLAGSMIESAWPLSTADQKRAAGLIALSHEVRLSGVRAVTSNSHRAQVALQAMAGDRDL